ncbi:probable G-protein coupled receptor 139 [Eurytemora carolleeae]|uniref:probable G-protein coupled receptor 139 n=1 Tax=Eurytemora carolleeae TaxID=1294199 RepID=UPI000C7686C0|nr:probable G-protein coupled receptor 139 [Eurytemora carolleeae]|eukprot:XP_023328276.1 probable G-protein coupled receptor 139 [Eurytemora affinis]
MRLHASGLVRLILTGLIPMVLLTFLNYKIIQGLRSSPAASRRAGSESRQALTLVVIAWIFLICHTPRILLNLVENLQMEHFYNCQGEMKVPAWFHCLTGLNHLLLILNSSINFLIYCVCGTRFRKELSMLCRLSFLLQRGAVHEVVELCNNNNNSPALTSAVERYPTTAVSTRGTPITAVSTRGAPTTAVSTRGAPTTAVPTRGTPTTAVSTRGTPTTAVSTSGTPNTTVSGRNLMTTTV